MALKKRSEEDIFKYNHELCDSTRVKLKAQSIWEGEYLTKN
jgi:hypothetical protein